MRALAAYGAAVALLAGLLAGCADDEPDAVPPIEPSPSSNATPTESPSTIVSPAGDVIPTTALLDWTSTGSNPEDEVIQGAEWSAEVTGNGARAELTGPGESRTIEAGKGRRIDDVLLDDEWLVVVAQDKQETRPAQATVLELATGDSRDVAPEPASGGQWVMYGGTLHYPTTGPQNTYCLAAFDLASGEGEVDYCAPPKHGFSNVVASSTTTALMTFDDTRPVSCRTLATLTDGVAEPVADVPECTGWDIAATDTGAVWSVLPDEKQVEAGDFSASADGAAYHLGMGATGTLTPCGDSVYFARNGAGDEPAQLLRWTPDATLEIAYAAPGNGPGFLGKPACAGNVLTVSAFGAGGDEQVSAVAP
ncbi:MAG: hypothetical protein H0X12_11415 [Nocardioides sp.]|nr:hypothetical protein [Nocardioides sp.]